ncbi:flavin reductase family protein [Zhongshania sp.]|jgi:flavin reductase (DIM6/NTAB) family NADH-FMN oxidoreductase RutF|uniref:flavin reductase family protein n=1 Tax=Zhongshania sp. TaxID=1971902 RepID=UPI0039E68B74
MTLDYRELRNALGLFATGVTLITTTSKTGDVIAMTANSFSSLSLQPPLVLWSIDLKSNIYEAFNGAERFGVNILAIDQQDVADTFARSTNDQSEFIKRFDIGDYGSPVLSGSRAVLECEVTTKYIAGDHQILVGKVLEYKVDFSVAPLIFSGGKYHELGAQIS